MKSESIRCALSSPEIEVGKQHQSLEVKIKALIDLYFYKPLLEKESDYWFNVIIPYGNSENALTVEPQNIQLVAPESWTVNKLILDDGNICWHISNKAKLKKGDMITLSIQNIICNSVAGKTTVGVGCFALSPKDGEYYTISEYYPLSLSKSFRPIILDFKAESVKSSTLKKKTDGFTDLKELLALDSVAVAIRPYAVNPPSPPSPPVPKETKQIIVSWKTIHAVTLNLSDGGQLSGEVGTKEVSVSKSLQNITLTACSTQNTFLDQKTTEII